MKIVLLAGGFGTRIARETELVPKPMIEIGGMPILWHIMKEYSFYGFNEFIVLLDICSMGRYLYNDIFHHLHDF